MHIAAERITDQCARQRHVAQMQYGLLIIAINVLMRGAKIKMNKGAILSSCKKYRYSLHRIWDDSKEIVTFIGLNPSTADANEDDPTIRRCIGFAKDWGFGGLFMVNLFAFRATDPKKMKACRYSIGDETGWWIRQRAEQSSVVVAAWGNDGSWQDRDQEVRGFIPNLHYLRLNKSGQPAHPLYLPKDLKPIKWGES